MAIGAATVTFGAGDQRAVVTVTGQASILATSNVEAFIMSEPSADHSAYEHEMVPMRLRCGNIVAGAGFDIVCISDIVINGQWSLRWVWI